MDRPASDARRLHSEVTELTDPRSTPALEPGTRVEVRNRFDDRWSTGFEVIALDSDGFRIRRLSDGAELPVTFTVDDVRPERRKRRSMWWY